MPVNVIKKPSWKLLYYHYQGYCTSAETIIAAQEATLDYPEGQLIDIFDILEGELDIELEDVTRIIAKNKQLYDNGITTTHAAILTRNKTLEIFINAFSLIMDNVPTKIRLFTSLTDALAWLDLAEHEKELNELLNEFRK